MIIAYDPMGLLASMNVCLAASLTEETQPPVNSYSAVGQGSVLQEWYPYNMTGEGRGKREAPSSYEDQRGS